MCVYLICVFDCLQYVSALRPPKLTHHVVSGNNTTTNNRNGSGGPVDGRRRVCSLTYHGSALARKHDPPRHSLQNLHFSSQTTWSVEEELKRRRRLAGFDQSYGELKKSDSDSDPDSGDTMVTDEHEWKQVSDRKNVGSQ